MPQNYRHPRETWNSDQAAGYARGGRYRGGAERDRYQAGGEQRYSPERDRPDEFMHRDDESGFRGERSYTGSGYQEETGYQPGSGRFQGPGRNYSGNPQDEWRSGASRWRGEGSDYGAERGYREPARSQSAYGDAYDEAESAFRGAPDRDYEDYDTRGYYGTGNYAGVDEFAPIARSRGGRFYGGERGREPSQRMNRGTSGDYENYGRSAYGAQSSFGRNYGPSAARESYGPQGYGAQRSETENFRGASQYEREAASYGQGYSGNYGSPGNRPSRSWGQGYGAGDYAGQSHRGRGPKGYERSDERLREIICERLTDDPDIDASEVTVEVTGRVVRLTGSVNDRRTKYQIEELVERSINVPDIDNQLRVQSRQDEGRGESNLSSSATPSAGGGSTSRSSENKGSALSGGTTGGTPGGTSSTSSTSGSGAASAANPAPPSRRN